MRGNRLIHAAALSVGLLTSSLFGRLGEGLPYASRSQARAVATMSPWLKRQRTSHLYATGGDYLNKAAAARAVRRLNRAVARLGRLAAAGYEVDASQIASHIKRNAKLARAA